LYGHAVALLVACGSAPAVAPPPAPAQVVDPADVLAEADARAPGAAVERARTSPDADLRRHAALALARQHDPATVDRLLFALRDPDPAVRDAASLGLGALEDAAPDAATAALLGALAAETDPDLRGRHLEDLGRLATDEALASFPASIAADSPAERRGACRGLGAAALRERPLSGPLLERASARIVEDTSAAVRLACAYALSRAPAPEDAPADSGRIGERLVRALGDPDADVRAMAFRALARYPAGSVERIAEGTRDPDWTVAVHAMRTLASRREGGALAGALRGALAAATASGDVAAGGPLHVLLAGIEAAAPLAGDPPIVGFAREAEATLARAPRGAAPTRDRGLAHCAAARLVDQASGLPAAVDRCGLGQVTEVERRAAAAAVSGSRAGDPAAEIRRYARLTTLLADTSPIVRQAALAAAASYDRRDALAAILRALREDADIGVRIAALEAVRTAHDRRAARLASAVLSGAAPVEPEWPQADVVRALRAAADTIAATDDLEGWVTWLAVGEQLAPRELAERAAALREHPNLAVRRAARELLVAAGADASDVPHRAPANPIPASSLPPVRSRAIVDTERGPFTIELWPDDAPTTVARFVELARARFYDGLTFHRVVPAFVVQGGAPRGDGYGGPGWSQRCEDHRRPYERGTVGMALAGRDTGGSQFFVTVAPQPHLDARYTAFGRVTDGMEIVDRLQAGDRIRTLRIEPAP
jgi:cyclophilin family peptidyl-prolyl cis-trans isomerase